MKRNYAWFGITASLSYVLAVITGGFLVKDYNHLYNSISELTASNVPKIPVIYLLFFAYNALLFFLAARLYSDNKVCSTTRAKTAALMLMTVGLLGAAMLYFVQDPRNMAMSFTGKIHLILAGLSSILTMLVIILFGFEFKRNPAFKKLAAYSFISFAILFVTGGIAAASVSADSTLGGLFERLTIGTFIQWIFVISLILLKKPRGAVVQENHKSIT